MNSFVSPQLTHPAILIPISRPVNGHRPKRANTIECKGVNNASLATLIPISIFRQGNPGVVFRRRNVALKVNSEHNLMPMRPTESIFSSGSVLCSVNPLTRLFRYPLLNSYSKSSALLSVAGLRLVRTNLRCFLPFTPPALARTSNTSTSPRLTTGD